MAAKPINDRHKAFVREYIVNGRNATAAYRAIYTKAKDPDVLGPKLLGNIGIQTLILIEENKCEEKFEITRDMLIQQAVNIAFGSIDSVLDWDDQDVKLKPKAQMTKSEIKFVDGISYQKRLEKTGRQDDEGNEITEPIFNIKVTTLAKEKIKALEFIAKMMGFDRDQAAGETREFETALADALKEMKKK